MRICLETSKFTFHPTDVAIVDDAADAILLLLLVVVLLLLSHHLSALHLMFVPISIIFGIKWALPAYIVIVIHKL